MDAIWTELNWTELDNDITESNNELTVTEIERFTVVLLYYYRLFFLLHSKNCAI